MAQLSMTFGGVLILLGVGGYFGTGRSSMTALIPAFFGIALVVLGAIAARSGQRGRMIAMHLAALIGLVGIIGPAVQALPKVGALIAGNAERPAAIILQLVMGILCAAFTALCVRSFIAARRSRAANVA